MSDDLLGRATRALREETRDDDASARFTRSRIMASVHEERVRSRTRLAFLIPIAATFVAASAWGAANGKLEQAVSALSEAIGLTAAPAAPKPSARPLTPAPPAPPKRTEPAAPPAPPPEPTPVPEPVRVNEAPRDVAVPKASSFAENKTSDPAFELYRAAHQAHFVERDSARALAAWDAYLKAAPNAALALEARYNRALCLVRLQRSAEARAALRPFAEGRYGGYRKAEAAGLIAALPAELPGPDPRP
jgi:hypothetical protein